MSTKSTKMTSFQQSAVSGQLFVSRFTSHVSRLLRAVSWQPSACSRQLAVSPEIEKRKLKNETRSSAVCHLPFAISRLTSHVSLFLVAVALVISFGEALAQVNGHVPSDNRGDPNFRRRSNIDGNNVRATVFNFGFSGRTGSVPDEVAYEWPKNTNRIYVALVAIWKAGEVIDQTGRTIQIVDVPTYRNAPDGSSWSLEPVPGFLNPDANSIARSGQPTSWPTAAQGGWRDKREDPVDPGWVGSWNGFFGKSVINADQEMFYRTSDDLYDRFNYVPDATDPTRRGLGLLMDVRSFAWSQVLISDVVFFIHDILNDGTKRIPKASFLIWLADIVGNDAQDDQPFVDLQTSVAFLTDADRIGDEAFGADPVGVASIRYLETPGNAVDGIDNDGDADVNPALIARINGDPNVRVPLFTADDFVTRTIVPGEKIVLIDSLTFERRVIEYPQGGGTVVSLGQIINLPANGLAVAEDTVANSLDEDLDGLIDERLTLHVNRFDEISGTVRPVRYINYLSFAVGDTLKRGFIVPGKAAPQSYGNVAPMIDESRDDGFDNDNDWLAIQDDLGLDGVDDTGDTGEGDGLPSSGSGTNFPGEANIDKTDVSETDIIGLTSAVQDPAFGINFNTVSDATLWRNFMTPGRFFLPRPTGEYDTFVSSGFFPIEPGQRQRMAVSIAMAGGGINKNADLQSAISKQSRARTAFETDYQFAQAPIQVTMTAVPGDRQVTLYWDDAAEFSEDRFIKRLGGIFQDFEGYRIYRATDAAFLDAKKITDAQGVPTLLQPIAKFDKRDGIQGYHPIDINGVLFDLGDDGGLVHTYTDTGLVNGQRYFYAVTAYDFGYATGEISPTETPINVDVDLEGNVRVGTNVAVVRPRAPVAGYLPAGVTELNHLEGTSSGQIGFTIVEPRGGLPNGVKDGHEYEMTFQDTLIRRITGDILTTKNFTLTDRTDNVVKLFRSRLFATGEESPLIDGFRLFFVNEERVQINTATSRWSSNDIYTFQFSPVQFLLLNGEQRPNDYEVIFGDVGIATSKDTTIRSGTTAVPLPARPVNFRVLNFKTKEPVIFAFAELNGNDGKFSTHPTNANLTDTILFLEPDRTGQLVWTWQLILRNVPRTNRNPETGDTLNVFLRKPFLSTDVYRFTVEGERESVDLAREELNRIKVVPNPYVAAASWEPRNTFASGRGSRELHFTHLPRKCTIRIFNVNGVLIDTIDHNTELDNGDAIWDMLSKDNIEIAYGIYVYHIDAPGIGQKTGTFAIIK